MDHLYNIIIGIIIGVHGNEKYVMVGLNYIENNDLNKSTETSNMTGSK